MSSSNPLVEIVHHSLGIVKVRKNFSDLVLNMNHMKDGGPYCKLNEVGQFFEVIPDNMKKPQTRKKVVKKEESVSS